MTRTRHLERAPITEALVDIQVENAELSLSGLSQAFEDLNFGYYLKGQIAQRKFEFRLTSDGQPAETTAESEQIGLRLHSDDEKYVAQCRVNGFTLSRLPPYEDWQALVHETRRLWNIYRERTAPKRVVRVATRFINNLQLPLQHGESFQKYLTKFADVPEDMPQALTAFFQRFQLKDVSTGASVNLTLALDPVSFSGPVPVIIDIDAFYVENLEPGNDKLWQMVEDLRNLKNRCFFGALTDSALELYA